MNTNLELINLIHDITQADFQVQFCGDFTGMTRIEFRKEYDETFYEHQHLGFPDCERERLVQDIITELKDFKEKNIPDQV